ncbi:glycerol-1-phosphate dehydrogenase [NAD(P)+] [Nocardioides scoriae]|uniref:Glycerol-1-phosphate dehydrogenase [NAD(P)+] n=2 Tax=Nocardioides scoriae TaxID=642780 RepID=A0A1H1QXX2_9ACTN|nr:glycerol-1-phosphate dehydrogenase [NAD(P)+] [Nocardioides scoriae]
MPILTRMLPSPLVVEIKRGAVADLSQVLQQRFISGSGDVVIAVGPSQGQAIWEQVRPTLPDALLFEVPDASLASAGRLQEAMAGNGFDAVVGIGGGRTLDVAKYAATRAGVPMVAVATNLAHDGICSPVASLEHRHGKGSYGVAMPLAVLVDLDYVQAAPARLVRAGIGDVISNLSAVEDWELANRERGEPVDGLALALARTAAEAVLRRQDGIESDDFLITLAQSLVLSGMSMSVAGSSRPCSGACHEILHAVDQLYPGTSNHGELAGLGALFATHLRGQHDLLAEMRDCLERHDLPVTPAGVGLDDEAFVAAVMAGPGTRPDRYTVLEHRDLDEDATRAELAQFLAPVG